MSFLKYVEGAKPAKRLKLSTEAKKEKLKYYEAKRERSFQQQWLKGREWLIFDQEKNAMLCQLCKSSYAADPKLKSTSFVVGSNNFRASAISDHEKSKPHVKAAQYHSNKNKTPSEKAESQAR